jgi:hypothetical protein
LTRQLIIVHPPSAPIINYYLFYINPQHYPWRIWKTSKNKYGTLKRLQHYFIFF